MSLNARRTILTSLCRKLRRLRCSKTLWVFMLLLLITFIIFNKSNEKKNLIVAEDPDCFSESIDFQQMERKHSRPHSEGVVVAPRILLLSAKGASDITQELARILVAHRFKYKVAHIDHKDNLHHLLGDNESKNGIEEGRFAVIIVADLQTYLNMDAEQRDAIADYCSKFHVKVIAFANGASERMKTSRVGHLTAYKTVNDSSLFRIAKGNREITSQGITEAVKFHEQEDFEPLLIAVDREKKTHSVIVRSKKSNEHSSMPHVIFGLSLTHTWSHLLLLDAISFCSLGTIQTTLKRRVMVDIDDIFVGKVRLAPADVRFIVQSQERIRKFVKGFRYNLGFSGGYFHRSNTSSDIAGDDLLLELHNEFSWFPHSYQHFQAHQAPLNSSKLIKQMILNKKFAMENHLDTSTKYAVAPHHSGVYPVHDELYQAWRNIWGIEVTSTEEYPHLRPARLRRGFVYKDIKVLPRQTCGLFTKNVFYDEYPGGPEILESSIAGGELFLTVVDNEVNIFMSHMPNYAGDRLAPYVFESLVKKMNCWTNFELVNEKPLEMAQYYFKRYPQEVMPVWGNPCLDPRHLEIWSPQKSCNRLPDILVLGPQKSGSTALARFMSIHPKLIPNRPSTRTFEEVQFFGDNNNYVKGIDWYISFFPERNSSASLYFEKSANYFDHRLAPMRAHQLLPNAFIIAILITPWDRAYSWYQHMRAHEDGDAMMFSFDQVLNDKDNNELEKLRARCLEPGKYALHLERWLSYYSAERIYLVDGDELKSSPDLVLNNLQKAIGVKMEIDYRERIKYSPKKGFFCEVVQGKFRCLGKGKGRRYNPMSAAALQYLQDYYKPFNKQLLELFKKRLHQKPPKWLTEEEITNDDGFYEDNAL